MEEDNYPGVIERVKAVTFDGIVYIGLMYMISYFFLLFEKVNDGARAFAFIFIFLIYEPIFTSLFGGSIGHMLTGIRVKRELNENKNIFFPKAILRCVVKLFLGWISLLTVSTNDKRKAIHDYIVGSVVVYAKAHQDQKII